MAAEGLSGAPAAPAADGRHARCLHARDGDGRALEAGRQRGEHRNRVVAGADRRSGGHGADRAHRVRRLARHLARHAAMAHGDRPSDRDALRDDHLRDRSRVGACRLRGRRRRRRLARPDARRLRSCWRPAAGSAARSSSSTACECSASWTSLRPRQSLRSRRRRRRRRRELRSRSRSKTARDRAGSRSLSLAARRSRRRPARRP